MRNKLSDIEYAIGEDGKGGNKAFRVTFLGYTDRNITKIDFEKNAFKRNENDKIRLAVKSTIDALNYFDKGSNEKEDISKRAIGWHGIDILIKGKDGKLTFFQEKLFIEDKHIDNFSHPKYGKWKNNKTLDKSMFVSVSVHKTEKGLPTLFYKTTELGYKNL